MSKATTLKRLSAVQDRIGSSGIASLYLFGSAATGRLREASDVDLLFEIDPSISFSLIDQARLQSDLSAILERPVDLVERAALRPSIRHRVEAAMVRIF